jgi:DNA-binding CsgD family transcriptional regulator
VSRLKWVPLTVNAQLQKIRAAIAEENTRFHRVQRELQAALSFIALRWKEETERAQKLAVSFKPLIDSRWKEAQERLRTLRAPVKVMDERIREALQPFQQEMLRVQKLAAPIQAIWQDSKARLQPFIDWMASEAYQKQAQQMSDIHTLVGAYCPKYRESYLEYHQEDWINNALTRLMAQLRPGLRNPRAAQALRQKAKIRHTAPQNFLRTEVFPTAIRLVASEVTSTQRLRIGRKWVTNMHGKVLVASPWETPLTIPAFIRWFFSQVYAAATAIVLDEVYPRPTTQQAQLLVCEEHTLERLAALKSSSLRDNASLTVLLREDEVDPSEQLHQLLPVASPRAKELLLLLCQGLSRNEAAQEMGISRSTVDVLLHRERKKACRH